MNLLTALSVTGQMTTLRLEPTDDDDSSHYNPCNKRPPVSTHTSFYEMCAKLVQTRALLRVMADVAGFGGVTCEDSRGARSYLLSVWSAKFTRVT